MKIGVVDMGVRERCVFEAVINAMDSAHKCN